jgi:hypothetical protein
MLLTFRTASVEHGKFFPMQFIRADSIKCGKNALRILKRVNKKQNGQKILVYIWI